MDPLKEAFSKVRQEIDYLHQQIEEIKYLLNELKSIQTNKPTNQQIIPSNLILSPTQELSQNRLNLRNSDFSTGNEGVPTNKPTNQQTNQHPSISTPTQAISSVNERLNQLHRVSELLGTLDDLKKEVRLKFKKLTEQEMNIFSAIYELEEKGLVVDYAILAQKTNLTEISIRDYIRKILAKGIPLKKEKESNKRIILSIPQDLKRIATLLTINQLRDI